MPTPFVADAADEAVRSNSILNERKATDIIEETALEVDIRAWRAEGLRLLQAASAREDHVPNGARRPTVPPGAGSLQCINQIVATRLPPLLKHGPHAIDATPARRRGGGVRTAAVSP